MNDNNFYLKAIICEFENTDDNYFMDTKYLRECLKRLNFFLNIKGKYPGPVHFPLGRINLRVLVRMKWYDNTTVYNIGVYYNVMKSDIHVFCFTVYCYCEIKYLCQTLW